MALEIRDGEVAQHRTLPAAFDLSKLDSQLAATLQLNEGDYFFVLEPVFVFVFVPAFTESRGTSP